MKKLFSLIMVALIASAVFAVSFDVGAVSHASRNHTSFGVGGDVVFNTVGIDFSAEVITFDYSKSGSAKTVTGGYRFEVGPFARLNVNEVFSLDGGVNAGFMIKTKNDTQNTRNYVKSDSGIYAAPFVRANAKITDKMQLSGGLQLDSVVWTRTKYNKADTSTSASYDFYGERTLTPEATIGIKYCL